ncbi:hypothetical protein COB52_03075 [Candidatus Kaiserbacteria bacterium]|nr:MAG: hypothetical protein COB52_03075 [Candidatus Kaiserbacteria bacterium]
MMATIAFSVSLASLILFFVFKYFENSRDFEGYNKLRNKGDAMVISSIKEIKTSLLHMEEHFSFKKVIYKTLHGIAISVAYVAGGIERQAHKVTLHMTHRAKKEVRQTKSEFFEKVETHKNGLDTERIKRETSLTSVEEVTPE